MQIPFNTPVVCPIVIGRTVELTALRLLIDRVKSGSGHVALLFGEAGIGKSRLVTEMRTETSAQGFLLVQGNCFPTDRSCPYAPLLDLLRSHFATSSPEHVVMEMGSLASALSPLLPDLVPLPSDLPPLPPLDPEQEKRRLFAALAHLFIRQTTKHPVLLVVEDLHWSDDTSLEFLHYLARRCTAHPLLVLLTYRSDEVHPSLRHFLAQLDRERLAQAFTLARLTQSEVGTMLRAIFDLRRSVFHVPRFLQGELLGAMYTLTEGNPFFIEEILQSLIAAGEIFYADGAWNRKPFSELRIPASIQDAMQQRIDRLSDSARRVLVLAAVAGRRFDFALLQQLAQHDEDQLLQLIKELISAQLVVEESEEQFAFRHALTRQAIYTDMLVRERKALHRAIADTMEHLYVSSIDAHLADLAYHFYEASAWAKALEYGQRAGEKAQTLYASRAAIEHFTHTLEAAQYLAVPPLSKLYRARGQAYERLGKFEQARADYEQALHSARAASDQVSEWQSLIDLGFLWAERDYGRGGSYYQQALEFARTMDDPVVTAHSLNRLGNWHLNVEQPLEAIRCHQEALATFQTLNDQQGLAETLDLLGLASYNGGDLIQSRAYYLQAIALFRELDQREGLISGLATQMACAGNYQTETLVPALLSLDESLQLGEEALRIAREISQRSGEAFVLYQLGQCLGPRGEYARAFEMTQECLSIAEEIEHSEWMTAGHWYLGLLYLDVLALSEALQHLEQALALAHHIGSQLLIRSATGSLAFASILQQNLAQAEALLNTALGPDTPSQTTAQRTVWTARAELALAHRDPDQALHIADQLIASAAHVSDGQSIPHLSKLRGEALTMLNRLEEAEIALQAAHTGAVTRGLRPLLWRIAIDLGNLYRAWRRDEEAEHAFATAQELVEELAATIPDTVLCAHFLQQATALLPHQEPLSPRRAAKRAFGGLTEREREVAALIAQGKASREIAEILVVNSRTIEKHIENILSKLGFTSRAQIAVWATEKGLGEKEQGQV